MAPVWFLIGAALFLAALALGLRRWWPRLEPLPPAARFTLIVTTLGGLIGAPFWWLDLEPAFAWDLPPLASRLLGAAAVAFGLAGLFVIRRPSPARARAHALLTAVYLAPLALVLLVRHLDRLDFAAPITWAFLLVVAGLTTSALASLAAPVPGVRRPARGGEGLWLLLAGLALILWGGALFAVPAAPLRLVFVWPADPLTSRLIAAMLLTLGLAFWLARGDARLLPQARIFGAAYGLGGTVAVLGNVARGLPFPSLYLAALGVLGLVSAGFLIARRPAHSI